MKVGLIGRWKPLHNGGMLLLETVCGMADEVVIGIGSVNKYDARNPFTAVETEEMLRAALPYDNYRIVHVPDFAHIPEFRDGNRWKENMLRLYGALDAFVTGNPYVAGLLGDEYRILTPGELIPRERQFMLRATVVRVAMARGEGWEQFVPQPVARFIKDNGLDIRFRREFGLETLGGLVGEYWEADTAEQEAAHTRGGL